MLEGLFSKRHIELSGEQKISVIDPGAQQTDVYEQIQQESLMAFSSLKKPVPRRNSRNPFEDSIEEEKPELEDDNDDDQAMFERLMFPDFKNVKVMRQGEAFGEIALITYAKRLASLIVHS